MKLWSSFYDYVMPELPGIDSALVDVYLRDKAIDFCEQTWCLVDNLDAFDTVADTYEYDLDSTETGMEVFAIKQAWVDDAPIDPITMDDLYGTAADWRTYSGKPRYYAQENFGTVLLFEPPDGVYSVSIAAVLRPKVDATGVPDRVYSDYRRIISWGTLAALMAQPAKPWSNPERSDYYRREYEAAITKSTVLANRARARATVQVTFRKI